MPQDATMARFAAFRTLGLLALACALSASAWASAPRIGPDSGKPVPRYESLKYGEVNGRQGPSLEHRVLWTYHRRGLPLEIVAESGQWRQVRDPNGDMAWVHAGALDAKRTAFVLAPQPIPLHAAASDGAKTVALLGPGVVGQLKRCDRGWRALKVGDHEGWVPVALLWGADRCDPPAN